MTTATRPVVVRMSDKSGLVWNTDACGLQLDLVGKYGETSTAGLLKRRIYPSMDCRGVAFRDMVFIAQDCLLEAYQVQRLGPGTGRVVRLQTKWTVLIPFYEVVHECSVWFDARACVVVIRVYIPSHPYTRIYACSPHSGEAVEIKGPTRNISNIIQLVDGGLAVSIASNYDDWGVLEYDLGGDV